jgi:hypothetical protein
MLYLQCKNIEPTTFNPSQNQINRITDIRYRRIMIVNYAHIRYSKQPTLMDNFFFFYCNIHPYYNYDCVTDVN